MRERYTESGCVWAHLLWRGGSSILLGRAISSCSLTCWVFVVQEKEVLACAGQTVIATSIHYGGKHAAYQCPAEKCCLPHDFRGINLPWSGGDSRSAQILVVRQPRVAVGLRDWGTGAPKNLLLVTRFFLSSPPPIVPSLRKICLNLGVTPYSGPFLFLLHCFLSTSMQVLLSTKMWVSLSIKMYASIILSPQWWTKFNLYKKWRAV